MRNYELTTETNFADAWLCSPNCTATELTAWDTNDDDEIDSDDLVEWVPVIADEVFYSQRSYLLTDYKGSVIAKTNDTGGIDEILYDAWGNASVAQGVDLQGLSILWNGYYYDYETGNYYLRNRYYSPTERKFITEDPHGVNPDGNWNNPFAPKDQLIDGAGLQVYANHDPINKSDRWGLMPECDICGPDVTSQVEEAVGKTMRMFYGLSDDDKNKVCGRTDKYNEKLGIMQRYSNWNYSWDIPDLHFQSWINDEPYAGRCATGNCKNTVEVDGKCFYAGSVNYVIFGVMWNLCDNYEIFGKGFIYAYKRNASNYTPSKKWFSAGYNGWPIAASTPPSDRPKCKTNCSIPCNKESFKVRWLPMEDF
jgi:RHS repeat-associated protein